MIDVLTWIGDHPVMTMLLLVPILLTVMVMWSEFLDTIRVICSHGGVQDGRADDEPVADDPDAGSADRG